MKSQYTQCHCMVVHNSYPFAETRVERQAEALTEAGIEVDIICLRHADEPKVEVVNDINVYRLPMQRQKNRGVAMQLVEYIWFFVLAFFKLTQLYWHRRYAVVQVHNLPDFLIFVGLIPKLSGSRLILDLHDLMPEFFIARFGGNEKHWAVRILRLQEKLACAFADHVITVTEPWRQTLITRGVPADKCSVVMNLADDNIFQLSLQSEPKSKVDGLHFIYHGTLAQRYGIDIALRAVDIVRKQLPNVHLTVHGRGEYLSTLQALVGDLGIENFVTFSTKFLPTNELPLLIKSADVGLVPYRRDIFTDGILPTKLLEYAALGMPAIVAKTPGIAAYFDETMVRFFESENVQALAQCMLNVYHQREILQELASNIQNFSARYNWRSHKLTYIDLVKRLGLKIK